MPRAHNAAHVLMLRIKIILVLVLVVAISTLNLIPSSSLRAIAAPAAQGELLQNPGLEADDNDEYPRVATTEGGGAIAAGWAPWWYNDPGPDYSVPEFEVAPITRDPYRVHGGSAAQQLFRPSVYWKAGIYQTASVPSNARVRFTIWGHAWSSMCIPPDSEPGDEIDCTHYHDSYWGQANVAYMKIGIDPTGGVDWSSPNIIWSNEYNALDIYTQFSVEAQAKGSTVTVFTYTTFEWPAPVNNVYWDDASLVVVGSGSTSSNPNSASSTTQAQQSQPPASGPGRIPTQAPSPDGSQHHIVQTGETLGGIAVAYGILAQDIRNLNNLSSDIIFVGQDLLIRPAAATPTPTPEATQEPTTEPTQEVVSTPTTTPQAVAEVTAKVCVTLFDDANQNGLRDAAEPLLASGTLNLVGPSADSYTTNGVSEPYCFESLSAGDYIVSAAAPEGYALTGLSEIPVTLAGGSEVTLNFGAAAKVATGEMPALEAEKAPSAGGRSTLVLVGAGAGVLTLAAGGGLAAYLMIYRKNAGIE